MARILAVLENHPLFAGLPREELADLLVDCRFRTPFKGDRLLEAGEPADAFYLVATGEVKLVSVSPSGRESVVEVVGPGETVALVPALEGEPQPLSAVALTDGSLIRIGRAGFLALMARRPELGARTTLEVARRLRRFRLRHEEITTRTVPARVASFLLRQAEVQSGGTGAGAEVLLQATREIVAASVGTVREVFVRTLHGFERQGLVAIDGRRVTLLSPETLRDIAADRVRFHPRPSRATRPLARGGPARRPLAAGVA
jgi:CRP-like cAMP-binding protein